MGIKRDFTPNCFYHLISRGNNGQPIFLHRRDYFRYLYCLEKYSNKFLIKVLSYCLMPNHVHLLIQQGSENTVSEFMQALNTAYTMYFNLRHSKKGHLFQGPFRHIMIGSDEYLIHLSRYIHLNPSSAGLAKKPDNYPWSSYRYYIGIDKLNFVDEAQILSYFSKKDPIGDYKEFVE